MSHLHYGNVLPAQVRQFLENGSTGVVWNTHTHNTLHSIVITSDDREPGVLLTLSGWRITAKVVMGLMIWSYEASSSGLNLRYFTPRLRIHQAEMSVTM